jgi:hypothetical protein
MALNDYYCDFINFVRLTNYYTGEDPYGDTTDI